jgi:uncharacterized protein YkwD
MRRDKCFGRLWRWMAVVVCLAGLLSHAGRPTALAQTGPSPTLLYLPFISNSTPAVNPPPPGDWLAYTNYYRALADLSPVTERPELSDGAWLHARYMVKNDLIEHSETVGNPWYSDEGHAAAGSSNLAVSTIESTTDEWAIDTWMQAPFHAVGILDPRLVEVGYGSYREADGGFQMGAALDVISGRVFTATAGITFPIEWPGDGMTVPLTLHWGETPSPLTSCPGYSEPAGLPIILQLGRGELTPDMTGHSFTRGGTPLEHCVFDETSYSNPDSGDQDLGRLILDGRDAIVLIPREPLEAGESYTASITVDAVTHTWSFAVADTPNPQPLFVDNLIR